MRKVESMVRVKAIPFSEMFDAVGCSSPSFFSSRKHNIDGNYNANNI